MQKSRERQNRLTHIEGIRYGPWETLSGENPTVSRGRFAPFLCLEICNSHGLWVSTVHISSLCDLPPISHDYIFSTIEQNSLERTESHFLRVAQL